MYFMTIYINFITYQNQSSVVSKRLLIAKPMQIVTKQIKTNSPKTQIQIVGKIFLDSFLLYISIFSVLSEHFSRQNKQTNKK